LGTAIAYPLAKAFHETGVTTHGVIGYRNKDLIILKEEFEACCDEFVIMTDDGSYGEKGVVTVGLQKLLDAGNQYDEVIAIGPVIMMKFVCQLTAKCNPPIPTTISMNPIMIDGTGMCGCCRLTVGGETKFACVDGPDFDGHQVDFDEAMARGAIYRPWELSERE
jgi:ferredoxin--NADP+ reductase